MLLSFFGRHRHGPVGTQNLEDAPNSRRRGPTIGPMGWFWSAIFYPFRRSIYVRFRYAFGFAALGLAVITVITIVSGSNLLDSYKLSVSESRFEMLPLQRLQEALREADDLVYHYAFAGDQSAPRLFKEVAATMESQFRQLADDEGRFASVKHAHSNILLSDAVSGWREAQVAVDNVFQQPPGTPGAMQAVAAVHVAVDPIYSKISEFHRLSMKDLQDRLGSAHSIASSALYAIFGAILVGLGLLIGIGRIVGRSILGPISELQEAAHKLAAMDFAHRVKLRNRMDELGQLGKAFNIAAGTIQRLYTELDRRATHDGLTGVLNRATFDVRLLDECERADRRGRQLSFLIVDVDFFKRVNDNHGHQVGDRVLQTIARMLREAIRPGDIVARYGGEEFVIILPETGENSAMAMAERLRKTIEDATIDCTAGVNVNVTVSVGYASRTPFTMTPEHLIKAADAALYHAKKTGRNRVVSAKESPSAPLLSEKGHSIFHVAVSGEVERSELM